MKNALIMILTTLFVSFMTLNASYAQASISPPTAGDCATVETIRQAIGDTVQEGGGTFEVLSTADVHTFLQNVMDKLGQEPPFAISGMVLVKPTKDAEFYNIGYFSPEGCFLSRSQLPAELVNSLLNRVAS